MIARAPGLGRIRRRPPVPLGDLGWKEAPAFPNEPPQYQTLAEALELSWSATRHLFRSLRSAWFRAAGLVDPHDAERRFRGLQPWQVDKVFGTAAAGQRNLLDSQRAELDQAIEAFLAGLAGPDRSRTGYADPEQAGVLQESGFLGYQIGYGRGQQLAGQAPLNPDLTEAQKRRLSREAFARMSEDGKLRFESRLGEIKSAMLRGFSEGTSPLEIARKLGADLDGYEQGRLRMLVRTEMAFASEAAILDGGAAAGIERWTILGDPAADQSCVDAQNGGPYTTAEMRGMLPVHPQCFCSASPWVEES